MSTLGEIGERAWTTSTLHGFQEASVNEWPQVVTLEHGDQTEIGDPNLIAARLMLITTEVAEACEALRVRDLDAFAEELADVVIRVASLAAGLRFDLDKIVDEKLTKNVERPWRHGGKCL